MKDSLGFCADTERDKDVIEWYKSQDNKSVAIRAAIRRDISGVTLADLYEKLAGIEKLLRSGAVPAISGTDEGATLDPQIEKVREALDKLGV